MLDPPGVMRTIGLDDQTMPQAAEIDDVAADHDLSAKLHVAETAVAQDRPQRRSCTEGERRICRARS